MSEMGKRPVVRSGEKSNFSVTVSLLSQYIKEKGSLGDLGLGMAVKGKPETFRLPTTMSLLPGVDVSGDDAADTKGDVSERNATRSMELFPQCAGFGPSGLAADGDRKAAYTRGEPEKSQLTIFYGGKVLVFDNFPAEKAKDLMQIASKGSSTAQNHGFVPPPSGDTAPVSSSFVSTSSNPPATVQSRPQRPNQPTSDLPIARKASLHRFLEKRKDRINAKAPYQVNGSAASVATPKPEEGQPWLGLGPKIPKPSLSSELSR